MKIFFSTHFFVCASLKDFFTNGIIYNSLRSSTSVLRLFKIGSQIDLMS